MVCQTSDRTTDDLCFIRQLFFFCLSVFWRGSKELIDRVKALDVSFLELVLDGIYSSGALYHAGWAPAVERRLRGRPSVVWSNFGFRKSNANPEDCPFKTMMLW